MAPEWVAMIAAVVAALGAFGVKALDVRVSRGKDVRSEAASLRNGITKEATDIRQELRAEVQELKGEIDVLRTEVDTWKQKYYELLGECQGLRVELVNLKLEVRARTKFPTPGDTPGVDAP